MNESSNKVCPVVLSGGSGTRLWPMSRELYPKQLLPLTSARSLLQECLARVGDEARFAPPLIICNQEHRFIVAEQCREIAVTPRRILLEPVGRNTAPAAAAAALSLAADDPEAVLLVLPSDHVIRNLKAFHKAVDAALKAARGGALVTFGIAPDKPETGFGYIRSGEALDGAPGCFRVARFVEKPELKTARSYLAEGGWYWNSGMFLFAARAYLEELERFDPAMLEACRESVAQTAADLEFHRLGKDSFAAAPSRSIDYAVMEHTERAAVLPVEMGWSDVGSWATLWEICDKDGQGNVARGDVCMHDVHNSLIRAENQLIAVIGLTDAVIVATDDAILAAPRERAQEVKALVEKLKAENRPEPAAHSRVYRPWGYYQSIDSGANFQVKRITVNPGAKLSLQKHKHRTEHWVVVDGTARITRGEETFLLERNESTYIPVGVFHRLENPGEKPLKLIEVQSGNYLGEDDIIRVEDTYGRV